MEKTIDFWEEELNFFAAGGGVLRTMLELSEIGDESIGGTLEIGQTESELGDAMQGQVIGECRDHSRYHCGRICEIVRKHTWGSDRID